MKYSSIPVCYFPSTVLFVDDNQDFLMNFTLQLDDQLIYKIYDSPKQALQVIESRDVHSEEMHQRCVTDFPEALPQDAHQHSIQLDLSAIHLEVYNPKRFSEVSVVVVDYAMPEMNGLEFCKSLQNTQIQKILLTGQADETTAIEAFNLGIIDRFIRKNDPMVTEKVMQSVRQLQQRYFQLMSEHITKILSVHSPSILQEPAFVEHFKTICQQNDIVEFYLADTSGSFLLLDKQGYARLLSAPEQDKLGSIEEYKLQTFTAAAHYETRINSFHHYLNQETSSTSA